MNWVLLIIAAVAALIGGGLLWWRANVGKELGLMLATETSSAKDIAGKAPGTLVELKGALKADALLTSDFTSTACVYYRSLTEREVERITHDSDGKRETRREYETENDVVRFAPSARVEDASGSVVIEFDGAKVEGKQVHQRRESDMGVGALVGSLLGAGGGTIAHRYTEWVIEAGVPVYVLGTANGGKVGKAADKKQPFVISIKSEEEREKSLGRTRMWQMVGAVVALLIAAGLLYAAFTAGP